MDSIPPSRAEKKRNRQRAYTLVEICVTVAIVALLAVLSMIAYSKWMRRASKMASIKNLKNLGVGLGNYMVSNSTWPQVPEDLENPEEEGYWKWWHDTLEPYGIDENAWHAPWDEKVRKAALKESKKDGGPSELPKYWSSYVPTPFAEGADIPYKWASQPWAWERTDFSGDGQNCLMPDGRIVVFKMPPSAPPRKK